MTEVVSTTVVPHLISRIKYDLHNIVMSAFACMYFQSPSFLAYQRQLDKGKHRNNLQTLFRVSAIPQDSQLREVIDQIDSEFFRDFYKELGNRFAHSKKEYCCTSQSRSLSLEDRE